MRKIITIIFMFVSIFLFTSCNRNAGNETVDTTYKPNDTIEIIKNPNNDSKSIVIYFSRTNNTEKIANFIVDLKNADKFEIEAKIPYTDDDINYKTNCRANDEQANPEARPEIAGYKMDFSSYEIIYLGYPIWHTQAPKIMYTFVESYDLTGKTIIPFCTSKSSTIGDSATNLEALTHQGTWLMGKRFYSTSSKEDVSEWLDSISL